jgi:hypothetical protein
MFDNKIDFCTILTGPLTDVFVPIMFDSIINTTDTSNVVFHILNCSNSEKTNSYLDQIKSKFQKDVICTYPKLPNKIWSCGSYIYPNDPYEIVKRDTARNSNWMMRNCGDSEWVILSHFDILFKKDYIRYLRQQIQPDVGMIGTHTSGVMLINRMGFNQSLVGFEHIPPDSCFANPCREGRLEQFHFRYYKDPRCEQVIPIRGFDNGELLELFIQVAGWKFIEVGDNVRNDHFIHIASGSGHAGEDVNTSKRDQWSNYKP